MLSHVGARGPTVSFSTAFGYRSLSPFAGCPMYRHRDLLIFPAVAVVAYLVTFHAVDHEEDVLNLDLACSYT